MSKTGGDGSIVRYYCTSGRGMELFLVDEVKRKLAAEDVRQIPGKVLFNSSATIDRVCSLKAAERLFLLLKEDSPIKLSFHSSPARASLLQSRLLGDRNQWRGAVMTWSRLRGELASNADKTQRTATERRTEKEEGGRSEKQTEEGGKCMLESRKRTRELREEESENKRLRSDGQHESRTLNKERGEDNNREAGKEGLQHSSVVNNVVDLDIESGEEKDAEQNESNFKGSRSDHTTARLECAVENCSRTTNPLGEDLLSEHVENVSFRVNCKCSGSLSRCLSAQEVSKVMGAGLSKLLGWKVDLKNPQMEINVSLSDDYCLLGIPLTRSPLAKRGYIKTTGLRSTVAWALASLAQIQPGFSVVDPMCGVGTILIEAAQEHKAACFLGVDIDDGQLQKANENVAFAELGNRVHLLKASSMALPLPSSSVDAVICDLPFGRKFGTKTNMAANLPLIISEMERVLRLGGILVVLLSPQLSSVLKKLLIQKHFESKSNEEVKPQGGIQHCLVPSSEQQTSQHHSDVQSSPAQGGEIQLLSLKHQTTLRVSLGAIDGLIHKYVKTLF